MREVMRLIGRSLAPGLVLREMLHLMSELLGLNRGRIVLVDDAPTAPAGAPRTASIQHAYGLTQAEVARGRCSWPAQWRAASCRPRRWLSSPCPSRSTTRPSACWPATASAAASAT